MSFITLLTLYFSLFTGEYHTLLFPMMVLQLIREYGLAVWCGNFSYITVMRVALSNVCRLCRCNLSSTVHKNVLRWPSSLIVLSLHPSVSIYLRTTFQRPKPSDKLPSERSAVRIPIFLTFIGPCIVIYSCNKSQQDAVFLKFILIKSSTCFGQIYCPSLGVWTLYKQQ